MEFFFERTVCKIVAVRIDGFSCGVLSFVDHNSLRIPKPVLPLAQTIDVMRDAFGRARLPKQPDLSMELAFLERNHALDCAIVVKVLLQSVPLPFFIALQADERAGG